MTEQTGTRNDYVKKSTMLLVCSIALSVGFLGGVVLSAYKSKSAVSLTAPIKEPTAQQPITKPQGPTAEQASLIQSLEKETSQHPDNVNAWIDLGNLFFDSNQFEKSITAYEKALAINPNNANVQTDLGVMYRRSGQPQKAIAVFDKAIAIDPRHEVSRFNKGIVLMHDLNDLKGAMAAWEGLIRINPLAKAPNGILIKDMIEKLKQSGSS